MSQPVPFNVRRERASAAHRLVPTGELDIATAPILQEAFDAVYDDDGAAMIVMDLSELGFMDSTGIHLLLRITAACKDADRLRIINGSPSVVRILDIAGIRGQLPIISVDDDPLAPLGRVAAGPDRRLGSEQTGHHNKNGARYG